MIAGDRVRLIYADTNRGAVGQAEATELAEGVQAARRGGDAGAGCVSGSGGTSARAQCEHGVSVARRSAVRSWAGCNDVPAGRGHVVRGAGEIEITLASGHRLMLSGAFDVEAVLRLARGLSSP